MLVISRREGERLNFHLPDGRVIAVDCRDVGHGRVRLGIDAPSDVVVRRNELPPGRFPVYGARVKRGES